MSWSDQVFRYCERGADPSFWGEPLNAVSNGAFIIAAVAAEVTVARQPPGGRSSPGVMALILLVFAVGIGSFLFHTVATRWASLADVIPIGLFMLAYLGFALRAYLGAGWIATIIGLALYLVALRFAGGIECWAGLINVVAAAKHCLNGTAGYAPALIAMLGIGGVLALKRHPAGRYLVAAGGVFLVSMVLRTIDFEICDLTRISGRALGTHFMWHVLNAITLYLLLRAAVRTERRRKVAPGSTIKDRIVTAGP